MHPSLRIATLAALLLGGAAQAAESLTIDVHRDANCGCCKDWITYLKDNGFTVRDHVERDMRAVKQTLGVAPRLASCHTGVIDVERRAGYDLADFWEPMFARADRSLVLDPGGRRK